MRGGAGTERRRHARAAGSRRSRRTAAHAGGRSRLAAGAGRRAVRRIDGAHLKTYVAELAAIARRYRDNGHPQFWGRIIGTSADTENAEWLMAKLRALGLEDVHEQT